MDRRLNIIKGIFPGNLVKRDMKKASMTQRALANQSSIPYQTINAFLSGKRNLTIEQALKIEKQLGYDEGFLSILQTYYEIKSHKDTALANLYPGKPLIRKNLFWDYDFDKINWGKNKKAVIERILERGNQEEIDEIKRFYKLTEDELRNLIPDSDENAGIS